MANLPVIYTIQAFDAPQHSAKLQEIQKKLQSENRISRFVSLQINDDLSPLENMEGDDLAITLLTYELEPHKNEIKSILTIQKNKYPNIKIAEIIIDQVPYEIEYIAFPHDLKNMRARNDMDAVWGTIEKSFKDMFPKQTQENVPVTINWSKYLKVAGIFIAFILAFFIVRGLIDNDTDGIVEDVNGIIEEEGEEDGGVVVVEDPPEPEEPALAGEDCLPFNPQNIQARADGSQFLLTDGRSRMMVFRTREKADLAVSIIQHYKFDNQCFAVRPSPGLRYLTVQGKIPSGSFPGEDCIRINNPQNLTIRESSGTLFQVLDGNHIPFAAKSRAEAERIIEIVKHYNAGFTCFVERPNPGMVYLKK